MKKFRFLVIGLVVLGLIGCGCYESHEAAWQACNNKYNGKCRFLGSDFKVCEEKKSSFNFFGNRSKNRCLEIVRGEGISESYCDSASNRELIFNSNL